MFNRSLKIHRNPAGIACMAALAGVALASAPRATSAQSAPSALTSRVELMAAAQQAENAAMASSGAAQTKNRLAASGIRQRLTNGDFAAGDRIVLSYISDVPHTDTLMVRSGPSLELPARATVALSGVLRSELKDKVKAELLKYVKAEEVEVTPLTRVGVLGEVAHPGYFALRSDVPIADAIMLAGGPTATADVERSMIRRGNGELRSPDETRRAISSGMTLDQVGLSAGDEIVIGRRRDLMSGAVLPIVGALASVMAIFVAVHH